MEDGWDVVIKRLSKVLGRSVQTGEPVIPVLNELCGKVEELEESLKQHK